MTLSRFILIWWKPSVFFDPVIEQYPSPVSLAPSHTQLHWTLLRFSSWCWACGVDTQWGLLSPEKCCLATACMDLEGTVLSERSQRKTELHNLTYVWDLKNPSAWKQRGEWWLPGAGGVAGDREMSGRGQKPPVRRQVSSGAWCTVSACSQQYWVTCLKVAGSMGLKCQHPPAQRRNTKWLWGDAGVR